MGWDVLASLREHAEEHALYWPPQPLWRRAGWPSLDDQAESDQPRLEHLASRDVPDAGTARAGLIRVFSLSSGNLAEDITATAELRPCAPKSAISLSNVIPAWCCCSQRNHRRVSVFETGSLSAEELAGFDVTGRMSLAKMTGQSQFSAPGWQRTRRALPPERAGFEGHIGDLRDRRTGMDRRRRLGRYHASKWLQVDLAASPFYRTARLWLRDPAGTGGRPYVGDRFGRRLGCAVVLDSTYALLKRPD